MPSFTPRNPKGAGRKPSPNPTKDTTTSFRPDPDIRAFLAALEKGEKTAIINQAIREYMLRLNG